MNPQKNTPEYIDWIDEHADFGITQTSTSLQQVIESVTKKIHAQTGLKYQFPVEESLIDTTIPSQSRIHVSYGRVEPRVTIIHPQGESNEEFVGFLQSYETVEE